MKNLLTPLAKNVLVPLGLTTTALATDAAIQKTTLMFPNEEIDDIIKIFSQRCWFVNKYC